ncbi:TetR/AcrR family transcriptional regulator [Microbacterium fluvii]|uniref:TetR/AcrR family transcriptional regulator n=1 Tax=Microbacterium fluvii TaxID=415215 RepID=A0ABW2HDY2_9MICO|nr:TetR/AcrR family transcriptional regulator [Microbacterium fluvii]MCU4672957.1 TetR/AcrR family transcriptional regulator [Microbacterium fluvii]
MSTTAPERTRPRDRKQRIEDAAALAFAEHGYHGVGMSDVAAAVGISAPALYRHFPNKYALFVRTALALAHRLIEDTDAAAALPLDSPGEARAAIDALLDAVISTTIQLRATGGIYRWEGRYLERDDRDRLTAEFTRLRGRFEVAHRVLRPEVDETDRRQLVLAALSAVASITAHHTVVAAKSLRMLLRGAAWRVLEADLPAASSAGGVSSRFARRAPGEVEDVSSRFARSTPGEVSAPVREAPDEPVPGAPRGAQRRDETQQSHSDESPLPSTPRREQLVESAIRLFAARGYNEVTIEDLATQVGLTPSGIYRHFEGKSALLLAACDRAAVELERAVLREREAAASADDALARLCRAYVDHTFAHLGLMRVYFSEIGNLAPDEQRRLRALQRAHIADWVALLQAVRPELSGREAAVLVHAGLGVVADQAPLLEHRDASAAVRLTHLVEVVLGVA